jgi:hypothetical protein
MTVQNAAREEERPQSVEANICPPGRRHKRCFGTPAMHFLQLLRIAAIGAKKKAPSEDGA